MSSVKESLGAKLAIMEGSLEGRKIGKNDQIFYPTEKQYKYELKPSEEKRRDVLGMYFRDRSTEFSY